jgi:glc operon protein GlcG
MRNRPTLTSEDVHKMLIACKKKAQENKWIVSIAIVDDSGALLQFERLDWASPLTATVALGKAQTAAALRLSSKMVGDLLKEMPGLLKLPVGIPVRGGVPLMYQGECVGAIGVSGMQADQDEQVALAGAATIG